MAGPLVGRKPVWRAGCMSNPRAAPKPAGEVIDIEVRDLTPVLDRGEPKQRSV